MESQSLYNDKRKSLLEDIKMFNLYALKSHIVKLYKHRQNVFNV